MSAFKLAASACLFAGVQSQPSIYDTIQAVGNLSTLKTVVTLAGAPIISVLNGTGLITAFAPSDAAFGKLSANVLDFTTNTHNVANLRTLLTYHVATGAYNSTTIPAGPGFATADAGQTLTIGTAPFNVTTNANVTASVTGADNLASNGYAHIIDTVLVPTNFGLPTLDIVATATTVPTLSTLLTLATTAGVAGSLQSGGPWTVLAPNNAAFAKLIGSPYTGAGLTGVLGAHVISTRKYSEQIVGTGIETNTSVAGITLTVTKEGTDVYVNGISKVITADVQASNGVVHIVDTVISTVSMTAIVTAAGTFSTLLSLVVANNLNSVFTNMTANSLTLFAPTDTVFAAPANVNAVSWATNARNAAGLVKILKYHVVPATAWSRQLTNGQVITTAEGQTVTVTIAGPVVKINAATVTTADVNAYNGAIHVIDSILIPADAGYPTLDIVATAQSVPTFSSLVTSLSTAGLVTALSAPAGPFTVFAPNDAAFAKLPASQYTGGTLLADVLNYHVVSGRVYAAAVKAGSPYTTLNTNVNNLKLVVTVEAGNVVYVNGISKVIATDADCSNGVVHTVDTVIASVPISSVAVANGLTTLVSAVTNTGLLGVFSDMTQPNSITVFAPTDAAFALIDANVLSWLNNKKNAGPLAEVLNNHVIGSTVWSRQLTNGQSITTVGGGSLTVSIIGAVVKIGNATVTTADVNGYNGAVHVIDQVLLPSGGTPTGYPNQDVVDTAIATPTLFKLFTLLTQASLTGASGLASPAGPFTVFAPVDSAFAMMPSNAVKTIPLLTDVLKYHVIPQRLYAADLVNGTNYTTLQGLQLTVMISGSVVTLRSASGNVATVTQADVDCSNGAVHLIDSVLLPVAVSNGAGSLTLATAALATVVVAMLRVVQDE